ncbi:MAG: cupin domain-containing protein [Ferruginibacter sp.]
MNIHQLAFTEDDALPWQTVGEGVQRKIMTYDTNIMLVKVKFATGAIGSIHQHHHAQVSFVASGSFEVEIEGAKKILCTGDTFYAAPNKLHGVVCREAGMLVDVFTPHRKDFIAPTV